MRRLLVLGIVAITAIGSQGCALLLLPSAVGVGAAVGVEVDQVQDWLRREKDAQAGYEVPAGDDELSRAARERQGR
jgi:hypothetical protein